MSSQLLPNSGNQAIARKSSALTAMALGAALSLVAVGSTFAQTKVTFELRPVLDGVLSDSSPGVIIGGDGHSASVLPGSVLVFQLFANMTSGLSASTFTTVSGSIVSQNTNGGILGALRGGNTAGSNTNNPSPFTGTGAQGGAVLDLTGGYFAGQTDGITDVGDTFANANTGTAWFIASSQVPSGNGNGTPSILIGEFQLTLNAASGPGTTTFGFEPRPRTSGSVSAQRHVQFNDGNGAIALRFDGSGVQGATAITNGIAYQDLNVTVIPEPSVAVTLLGGVATLLGLRRRKH